MMPTRVKMLAQIRETREFDVLIVGGGATGVGAALDGAARGLKVLCVEREDFSSGTSSRSTKLIWGGSRYLVQCLVSLFSLDMRLLFSPIKTIRKFMEDFKMVLNCHRERRFLLQTQPHLTNWLPIAVPLTKWILNPPPFGYPPAALGPLGLFPLFFKFYDSLAGFTSPPSHIMTPSRATRKFPQLRNADIKYCSIFYEGQHDDARTNLAIAQTAALNGAVVLNYCDLTTLASSSPEKSKRIDLAVIKDTLTGESFEVRAKSILLCGGPFTDGLLKIEGDASTAAKGKVVNGASGVHVVLPSYYAPSGIGLVDMSTSDGRFLFFLPWANHVLVGTTDRKEEPSMRPEPDEAEIRWILAEASKYLDPELRVRREDVLSAWSGIRPLAMDPHASASGTASASRDHIISTNPTTGVIFVAGGKWTTYREMAEDAIDKVVETIQANSSKSKSQAGQITSKPCSTLSLGLVGLAGYTDNLHIRLIQEFGIPSSVAERLSKAYGGRAYDVLNIASDNNLFERLANGYPYLEAEVVFAARHEWAYHPQDVLARRTRLLFLNKEKALAAIPRVVQLMGNELGWDEEKRKAETLLCIEYMAHFGGKIPLQKATGPRIDTLADITSAFTRIAHGNTTVDALGVQLVANILGRPLSKEEIDSCMGEAKAKEGITLAEFASWYNSDLSNALFVDMKKKVELSDSLLR